VSLEVEQLAQKAFAAFSFVAASVVVVVVIVTATAVRFGVGLGCAAWWFWLVGGLRGRARWRGRVGRSRTFDDLVQLAAVQPDATAFGAIVNLYSATVGDDEGFVVYWAAHGFSFAINWPLDGECGLWFKLRWR
jgi:hypothetical protein